MGKAVEENEGLHPHIRWTKIPDFVHVYRGISLVNSIFFLTLCGLPRMPHPSRESFSKRSTNTKSSKGSLFFVPKLREPPLVILLAGLLLEEDKHRCQDAA
jgi:hypothetical protein